MPFHADEAFGYFDHDVRERYARAPTFDFSVVLPLVLDLLVGMLSDCLNDNASEDDAIRHIRERSFWAKRAARMAVARTARESGQKIKRRDRLYLADTVCDCCAEYPEDKLRNLVHEVNDTTVDFDSLWG